jgi:hypothetical protein
MSEDSLKQVAAAIAAKRTSLTPDEAKDLAVRAVKFKKERGPLPSISSQDAWERRMAEGAAAFVRFKDGGRQLLPPPARRHLSGQPIGSPLARLARPGRSTPFAEKRRAATAEAPREHIRALARR